VLRRHARILMPQKNGDVLDRNVSFEDDRQDLDEICNVCDDRGRMADSVFKTTAIDHSAIPPHRNPARIRA
jgi:hypothetical protein